MKPIRGLFGAALALLAPVAAIAQSSPNLRTGQVPTAAQWNSYFAAKQDVLGFVPVNKAGDVMTGPLKTIASSTVVAGFSILPGSAPASPNNGDLWMTSAGLFYRAGGTTVGPVPGPVAGSFAATAPLAVAFPSSVVTYSITGLTGAVLWGSTPEFTRTPVLGVAGSVVGSLGFQNATTGTVTIEPATGALGTSVWTLRGTTDNFVGAATTDIFTNKTFDTAATGNSLLINGLAATANTGTGAVVRATGGTLVTPALGVATATSLAINGCTIGSDGLCVTGSANFSGAFTLSGALTYGGVTLANAVTGTGSMVLGTAPSIASPTFSGTVAGANTIPLTILSQIATNTVLGNATSGTANVTAMSMTSCSTASSAVIWTTNTGFGCNTSITAAAVPASGLTGTTLASNVVTASLTTVGALAGGSATTGFTINAANVTWSGQIPGASVAVVANASGAPSATFGVMKGDGTTLTCASGVCSAVGGTATAVTIGTTTVSSGTTGTLIGQNGASPTGVLASYTPTNGLEISGSNLQITAARRTLPTSSQCTSSGTACSNGGFNGSGTYNTPANVLWLELYMCGAGGGGGSSPNTATFNGAGGGGAGGCLYVVIPTPASTYTYANGAKGTGGAAPGGATGNPGTAGGNTCWNTSGAACTTPVYQASGGALGSGAPAASTGAGGDGGGVAGSATATSSSVGQGGSPGGFGAAAAAGPGGTGGGGWRGQGGGKGGLGTPGGTGTKGGGGGGGGGNNQPGGDGGDGYILVIEHYNSLLFVFCSVGWHRRRRRGEPANDNAHVISERVA